MISQNQLLQQMITGSNNGGPNIRTLTQSKDLENVPVVQLQQLKAQLLTDMEILEKVSSLLVYKEGGDTWRHNRVAIS